jgi:energy-coupling factor transporter ATP-binding protein EcfA2
MAALQLRKVDKRYGDTPVIHGVDLDVRDGEFMVFVGPSGCGKSTLLRMIAGLESVSNGDIVIDGARVNQISAAQRGLAMVFTHFTAPSGAQAAFANIWNDGGLFPTGIMGFIAGFQIATFAFVGIELVGTTAAEAKDPEKNLPKAINSIPVRVMLFYVVALTVIISVTPWQSISAERSPFVAMFSLAGLGIAASLINFVVLTSATSSGRARTR